MIRNLLYILRSLRRNWTFTTVAVLTLGLGLGANSAVLIFANTLLFHPLPYANSELVVNLWSSTTGQPEPVMTVSPADFGDWQKRSTSFAAMAAFNVMAGDLLGQNNPENVAGAVVTTNFFDVLGIQPMIGRGFDFNDENQPFIILSYSLWQRDFGGAQSVLGKKLTLGGKPYTVVGVMPPGFIHPEPLWDRTAEFWRPMPNYSNMQRGFRFLRVVGRLKPNVSLWTAAEEMRAIGARLASEFPQDDGGRTVLLVPLREQMFGDMYRPLFLLFFAAGAVLLVAWANVTNLQLARTNSRLQQLQIRLAIGARLHQVIFLIFGESIVLAIIGTGLGLLVGYLTLRALRLVAPSSLRGFELVTIDGRLLLFACLLALFSSLLIALPPAIRIILRLRISAGPQNSVYQAMNPSKQRTQHLIMAAQIALVLPLLVACSVLARSFFNLIYVDPGFDPDHLLTLRVNLPKERYPGTESARRFFKDFAANVKAISGVRGADLISSIPLTEINAQVATGISLQQGVPPSEGVYYRTVTEDYFQTMKISLHSGRNFNALDVESTPRVAIINAALTHAYFGNHDPVGQTIFVAKGDGLLRVTVVGVVGDVRSLSLSSPPKPELFVPFAQDASLSMAFVVRTVGTPQSIIGPIRAKVAQLDKQLTLKDIQTMEQILYARTSLPRFAVLLMGISSFLALALSLIGVGGVTAYIVSERSKEFGIRMAIGATRFDIVKGLLMNILTFASAGIFLGIALATSVKHIPADLIYRVKTNDFVAVAGPAFALIVAVMLACYLSIRGIRRIHPADLLRIDR